MCFDSWGPDETFHVIFHSVDFEKAKKELVYVVGDEILWRYWLQFISCRCNPIPKEYESLEQVTIVEETFEE